MTLKMLLTLNAIVATLSGIACLLIPASVLPLYAIAAEPGTVYIARLLGGALVGYGAVTWLVRDALDGPGMRGLVLAFFVGFAASVFGGLIGQLSGGANALGWSAVAIDALFALGYGYFAFLKPAGRRDAAAMWPERV